MPSGAVAEAKTLYDFTSYKDYLRHEIARNREVYGYQTRLARAAGCQRSFFSQAMNSHVQLTPEHACGLAKFFGLNDEQRAYLIDLLLLDRAATPELREFQRKKIARAQTRSRNLAKRFRQEKIASDAESAAYYANWIPSAAHILLTIPGFRTPAKIARRLGIGSDQALAVLNTLRRLKLAEPVAGEWRPTRKSIHLPKDSPFTVANHRNWREVALQESSLPRAQSVHYTGVYSLSREDHAKLQSQILAFLDESRKRVIASPEEGLSVFLCDFFLLDRETR
ncbi:MAG: hypothetical protein JST04_17255 [Bdellovibrionales bacterium]|nr:hypothetical protein [Bdellovibrionales bacterium]